MKIRNNISITLEAQEIKILELTTHILQEVVDNVPIGIHTGNTKVSRLVGNLEEAIGIIEEFTKYHTIGEENTDNHILLAKAGNDINVIEKWT